MLHPPFPRTRNETIDCDCPQPRPHGTLHTYHHGCGCDPCLDARRAHHRDYQRRRRAEGVPLLIDPQPTVEHLNALKAAGMSVKEISKVSGYSASNLFRVLNGTTTRIRSVMATDLQSIRVPGCAWTGCTGPVKARGVCARHYDMTLRAGRRERRAA